MVISDLIKSSLRKIGVIATGETPTAAEMQDSLTALQSMLRAWSSKKIVVFASVTDSVSLSSGVSTYTWGSGGTINTTRPHQLLQSFIRDSSGVDHPVDVVSEGSYRRISVKTVSARPYAVFPSMGYPLVTLNVYPTPSTVETMYLYSLKPFSETSSFDSLASTLALPVNYEEAIIYNLSMRMASEFGKAIPIEVGAIAASSYRDMINLNASNQVEPVYVLVPAGNIGSIYNINTDQYR